MKNIFFFILLIGIKNIYGQTAKDYFKSGLESAKWGRCHDAIEYFNKAIALSPNDANVYFNRGISNNKCNLDISGMLTT